VKTTHQHENQTHTNKHTVFPTHTHTMLELQFICKHTLTNHSTKCTDWLDTPIWHTNCMLTHTRIFHTPTPQSEVLNYNHVRERMISQHRGSTLSAITLP